MNTHGRNSKIITAYTALATVALGVVAFDFTHHEQERMAFAETPTWAKTVPGLPVTVPEKPVAQARRTAPSSQPNRAANAKADSRVTVASYAAQRPAM